MVFPLVRTEHGMRISSTVLLSVAALALGCTKSSAPGSPPPEPASSASPPLVAFQDVVLRDVPHVRQRSDFCGEACAEMALRRLGKPVDQNAVFSLTGLAPEQGRGAYTKELKVALERIGFQVGPVWHSVNVANAHAELTQLWTDVHADLLKGNPSIVCTRFDEQPNTTEHFRLVVGYDAERDQVIYHDPAIDEGAYLRMPRSRFFDLWPLRYEPGTWTVIRFRLDPKDVDIAPPSPSRFSSADFAQHVITLRNRFDLEGFHVVVQPPFVVVGDEPEGVVRQRATQTVKWTVDRLKDAYFPQDPNHILTIWLFKDRQSYREHAKEFFDDEPSTPYGYYSSDHRALVMNIATGGGTLVHEIVHPFVESNFPACPAWFNEGLGSLYEQCGDNGGAIWGYTNWRLAGLQQAIRAGKVPAFETLLATSENQFYREDPGTNYAQARYLCYYLQEKGLLVKFYREFHTNQSRDPTGIASLRKVLGTNDLSAFKKDWERYVLALSFP